LLALLKRAIPERLKLALRARRSLAGGETELPLLPALCDPEGLSIDVGANLGVFAFFIQRASKQTVAVEPHPELAARLARAFGSRARVLQCALSDHPGEAQLSVPILNNADLPSRATLESEVNTEFQRRTVTVPLRTIDSLGLANVGFLKVHVEGHEYPVLVGARETLSRWHPTVFVGSEERHVPGGRARIEELMSELGYAGFFIDHGVLRPISEFRPAVHQRPERAKRPGQTYTEDYIHNFIFVHPTRQAVLGRLRDCLAKEPRIAPVYAAKPAQ
jgi:FkbM family methyltransferase